MGQKLGQHFLKHKKTAEMIAEAGEISDKDIVLEIGPGKGILTEFLLKKAGKVIAIEKDKELVRYLMDRFRGAKNLKIIEADILSWKVHLETKFPSEKYKIVANIPYYITSRFLRRFLSEETQPELIVLMIQKEVAERVVSKPPRMSLLSNSVQAYGEPKILFHVRKDEFSPPPEVDSSITQIKNISKIFFKENELEEEKFFELLKKGFAHKRKTLKNNLDISGDPFKNCGLNPKARAQELSLNDWVCLYKNQI